MANQDVTRIASNIGALNSLWALQTVNKQLGVAQTRLSTGKRINSAADDPAGLTIATKLNSRSEGLQVALSNIGDAKNLLAVAEAGVGRITDILVQMKNKASQGASDTMGTAERSAIQDQLNAYAQQIDDIVAQTNWNGNNLIDGTYQSTALSFQTGADSSDVTNVNGLKNLSATGANGAFGDGTNLSLASLTASVQTATTTGAGTFTAAGITTTFNANFGATSTDPAVGYKGLTSGTYTVKVTRGTTTATSLETIELLDANGQAALISSTANGTGPLARSLQVDLSAGAVVADFGNGLTMSLSADALTAGSKNQTVTYSQGGTDTYTVLSGGATGDSLIDGVTDAENFRTLMTTLEQKLDGVNSVMAKIGAFTGRLEFKEDQVSAAQINVEASYNRIMNANMAEEQVNSSKYQILQQTAIAMLAQANQAPASLLTLFQ
jgi:flagellin